MSGITLLFGILIFVGLAKSQQKKPSKARNLFFAAAVLAGIAQIFSSATGDPVLGTQDDHGILFLVNAVLTVSLLLAWFGAWKVLAED